MIVWNAEFAFLPLRIAFFAIAWRRHPDSNRGVKVLQTSALTTWPWRLDCYFNANEFNILSR